MDQIAEFVDERQKSWCIYCGGRIGSVETNRDHVPSKSLLLKPYPENLPVVQVCKPCNEGFSLDEEYFTAFLSCVLTGSTEPVDQVNPRARSILESRVRLRERIESTKTEHGAIGGERQTVWKPEIERINRVIVKNARGHAFYEYGEPMLDEPDHVWSVPLKKLTEHERTDFESIDPGGVLPEVGSRVMTRVFSGQDLSDGWVIVQDGVYRYGVIQQGRAPQCLGRRDFCFLVRRGW